MNITYCDDYNSMSLLAGTLVLKELRTHSEPLLCAAAGNSPTGLYKHLVAELQADRQFVSGLRIIKLDEWGGLQANHPATCEHFLRETLLEPLKILPGNYISFESNPLDPLAECSRIQQELDRRGPAHVTIVGLGTNGHVGLIEPDQSLEPSCHVACLTPESLQHQMLQSAEARPSYGLTLGMQDILSSRMIVLLVTGKNKEPIVRKLLKEAVSSLLPASYLWTHPRVECIIDRESVQ